MEKMNFELKCYTGTKEVKAAMMTRTDATTYLGRNLKSENSTEEEGYLVVYEDGYKSWSPKTTFDKAYRISESFVNRMNIELEELHDRIVALHSFMLKEEFRLLNKNEKDMIIDQFSNMHAYYDALATRVNYYKPFNQ